MYDLHCKWGRVGRSKDHDEEAAVDVTDYVESEAHAEVRDQAGISDNRDGPIYEGSILRASRPYNANMVCLSCCVHIMIGSCINILI